MWRLARDVAALRTQPPREIGGLPVTGFEDLRDEQGRLGLLKGGTDHFLQVADGLRQKTELAFVDPTVGHQEILAKAWRDNVEAIVLEPTRSADEQICAALDAPTRRNRLAILASAGKSDGLIQLPESLSAI